MPRLGLPPFWLMTERVLDAPVIKHAVIETDQPERPLVAGASTKPVLNSYRRGECVHAQGEQMPLILLFDMAVRTLRGATSLQLLLRRRSFFYAIRLSIP
jgi:hypothetical protein